jgi:hypothetical protein
LQPFRPRIVLEVQREKDPDKKYSWLVYVAAVRARKRCPTIVLVVAPDAEVAAWAVAPIDVGLGRGSLSPLVLGPAIVPEVTDETLAEQEKYHRLDGLVFQLVPERQEHDSLQYVDLPESPEEIDRAAPYLHIQPG